MRKWNQGPAIVPVPGSIWTLAKRERAVEKTAQSRSRARPVTQASRSFRRI